MSWWQFFARWRSDLDEEIEAQIHMAVRDRVERGVPLEQARVAVAKEFGNVPLVMDVTRAMWGWEWLERASQDLKYALRRLIKAPGFTIAAVATLALGIGANTAIFELLDAVLLQSLPVKNPQQLAEVHVVDMDKARGSVFSGYPVVTNLIWEKLREDHQGFSGIAAWRDTQFSRDSGGNARFVNGLWVSGDFFRVLGVPPIQGRVFTVEDDRRGCGLPGAVISYGFWQQEFGGGPALGRKLLLNDKPVEVIGITPSSFFGVAVGRSFDVAVPVCSQPYLETRSLLDSSTEWWLSLIGRLDPGWSVKQVAAYLGAISPGIFASTLRPDYPVESVKDYLAMKLTAAPSAAGVSMLRETYSDPLKFLLGISGFVLLITCANLASLMLARTSAREREMAVRLAIGAGRWRLIWQVLSESLLLSLAGALAGAALARMLSHGLVAYLNTKDDAVTLDFKLDCRLFAFLLAVSLVTCVLFGLAPALRASRTTPGAAMKTGGHGMTAGRGRLGFRGVLVVSQVALSLVLLFSALLFTESLRNLLLNDPGFRTDGVLIAALDFTRLQIPVERRGAFQRQLLDRIRAIPSVDAAADTNVVPLSGAGWGNTVWIDGHDSTQRHDSNFSAVSSDYFKTLRIPIVAGRDFNDRDTTQSPRVAVVNETFARKLGLGANAVGARFWREATPSSPEELNEIVGVVKDTKYRHIRRPAGAIAYLALSQDKDAESTMRILVRSGLPMDAVEQAIRRTIREVSSGISFDFTGLQEQIRQSLLAERLLATLSGFFGALAVVLAMIGLYGVMSYTVAERTNEIGIRMALGAGRANVIVMILGKAVRMLVVGLVLGAGLSLAAASAASAMLFGLKPRDPATLALATVLLAVVALAASYLPARRGSKLDPIASLREE
ncbi:MAG: ABC transporter permease [Silvibacterium sp.]|nr:ABC transporter permease [Silvibacterium sp.]